MLSSWTRCFSSANLVLLLETPFLLVTIFSFLKLIVTIKCLFSLFILFYVHFNYRLLQRNFFQHFLIIFIEANLKNLTQEINAWAAHTSRSWRINSWKPGVIKQKWPQEMLICQCCKGSQLCEWKDISSRVQSYVPSVPWNPNPFCRTRSLFLTAFVMMRHCL
jgi:hypothetical protein